MVIKAVLLFFAATMVMGCSARGILYTSTIEPYSGNFHNTPVGTKSVAIKSYLIKEPITSLKISGEWDTDEIVRLARESGITDLHYIDIKTLSILLGTYRRQTLIVYGD
jgi:hypothetical protein